jgi:hypothetical protein
LVNIRYKSKWVISPTISKTLLIEMDYYCKCLFEIERLDGGETGSSN